MSRLTPAQAAALIRDGQTVACAGFVGAGHAEAVTRALEARFVATGAPRDLTLFYAAGQGDKATRGVNHFGHAGLTRRIIGGHWISAPRLGALVNADAVEAWNLPQGVICHLFRAIAGGKPGVITKIGLHTFVDPRHDGGRLTPRTAQSALEPRVELMTLRGEEHLFYPALPIDVALIRATTADERGNLGTEDEPFHQDLLAVAQAARNSGGIVIAQVKRVVAAGTLDPNLVRVPGILVDHIVVTEDPDDHWMTFGERHNPDYTRPAPPDHARPAPRPLDLRKIVQRRAFLELLPLKSPIVNLGVGMPASVGAIAREEGHQDFTLTVEAGPVGGTPAQLLSFGASAHPEAIIDQAAMFDFYDGGGLDIAFLGMAQVDAEGNVNVSKFGSRLAGAGGFINISQSARSVVFVGSFEAGKDGTEGVRKFVPEVEHRTFAAAQALAHGQRVLYVTERCVFGLTPQGLELRELAPGVDLQRDVLARMGFAPKRAEPLQTMDARIFREAHMGLREALVSLPLPARLRYEPASQTLFVNFERLHVTHQAMIDDIASLVAAQCEPLGHRVHAVVNYEGFELARGLEDAWADFVSVCVMRHYASARRYTTSAFLRAKLGQALARRHVKPHIFESAEEALAAAPAPPSTPTP